MNREDFSTRPSYLVSLQGKEQGAEKNIWN